MREKDGKKAQAEAIIQAEQDERARLEKEEADAIAQKDREEKEQESREKKAE